MSCPQRATLEHALAIKEAAYGPDHPEVAETHDNLASSSSSWTITSTVGVVSISDQVRGVARSDLTDP
jgi:hypothetical protein